MKLTGILSRKLNKRSFRSIAVGMLCLACVAAIFLAKTPEAFARNLFSPSPLLAASLFHFSGTPPKDLGVKDGKLNPCPSSPNCVCSHWTKVWWLKSCTLALMVMKHLCCYIYIMSGWRKIQTHNLLHKWAAHAAEPHCI